MEEKGRRRESVLCSRVHRADGVLFELQIIFNQVHGCQTSEIPVTLPVETSASISSALSKRGH